MAERCPPRAWPWPPPNLGSSGPLSQVVQEGRKTFRILGASLYETGPAGGASEPREPLPLSPCAALIAAAGGSIAAQQVSVVPRAVVPPPAASSGLVETV
jgi:hypothetical protein